METMESLKSLLESVNASSKSEAYKLGFDCGIHGPTTTNCHFSLFKDRASTDEWERGKAAGQAAKRRQ